jgi:hypothetical protein
MGFTISPFTTLWLCRAVLKPTPCGRGSAAFDASWIFVRGVALNFNLFAYPFWVDI